MSALSSISVDYYFMILGKLVDLDPLSRSAREKWNFWFSDQAHSIWMRLKHPHFWENSSCMGEHRTFFICCIIMESWKNEDSEFVFKFGLETLEWESETRDFLTLKFCDRLLYLQYPPSLNNTRAHLYFDPALIYVLLNPGDFIACFRDCLWISFCFVFESSVDLP